MDYSSITGQSASTGALDGADWVQTAVGVVAAFGLPPSTFCTEHWFALVRKVLAILHEIRQPEHFLTGVRVIVAVAIRWRTVTDTSSTLLVGGRRQGSAEGQVGARH